MYFFFQRFFNPIKYQRLLPCKVKIFHIRHEPIRAYSGTECVPLLAFKGETREKNSTILGLQRLRRKVPDAENKINRGCLHLPELFCFSRIRHEREILYFQDYSPFSEKQVKLKLPLSHFQVVAVVFYPADLRAFLFL